MMFHCVQAAAMHAPAPWHGAHNLHHLVPSPPPPPGCKIHFKWASDNYSVRPRHLLAPLAIGQSMRGGVTIGHLFETLRLIGSRPGRAQCINSSAAFALFSRRKVAPLLLGCRCREWGSCAPRPAVPLA